MDVGRFCGVQGAEVHATHMRIAEYVRALCERYPATGFTPHQEWIVEQTMEALQLMLADVQCSDDEHTAIADFLALATETRPGPP